MESSNDRPPAAAPAAPLTGRFTGRDAFCAQVRSLLAAAAQDGWRELILSDASFDDWPLGERAVVESLQRWSAPGRCLTLLACNYAALAVRHPRFVNWRRAQSTLVEARGCASADALDLPSAVWSPVWVLHRVDPVRSVGVSGCEPDRRLLLRERLEPWLRKSVPAFPATTLGL